MKNYSVIISRNGQHFGTVDLKTNYLHDALSRFEKMRDDCFSKSEGFALTLMAWTSYGEEVAAS